MEQVPQPLVNGRPIADRKKNIRNLPRTAAKSSGWREVSGMRALGDSYKPL
jgi:hypothetical protein